MCFALYLLSNMSSEKCLQMHLYYVMYVGRIGTYIGIYNAVFLWLGVVCKDIMGKVHRRRQGLFTDCIGTLK